MNRQEYLFIRNISWDLLIDARIDRLPVDINRIASVYKVNDLITEGAPLYNNAMVVSKYVLDRFGINSNQDNCRHLSVRILAPAVVLKELKVSSVDDIIKFTMLPEALAQQRFARLQELISRDKFEMSNMEAKVIKQFRPWIFSMISEWQNH